MPDRDYNAEFREIMKGMAAEAIEYSARQLTNTPTDFEYQRFRLLGIRLGHFFNLGQHEMIEAAELAKARLIQAGEMQRREDDNV